MNKELILACLIVSFLATSCNHVYKEYDKKSFPTYSWKSGQEISFSPKIGDINKSYTLTLGMRHLYGFPLSNVSVKVKTISPSGKESTEQYDFRVKDAEGKYISSCAGDICDIEIVVEDNLKFEEPGQYTYLVAHNIPADGLPGVMEIGLIIDEKE